MRFPTLHRIYLPLAVAALAVGILWLGGASYVEAQSKPPAPKAPAAEDSDDDAEEEEFKPDPYPLDRYQQLIEKSPFDFPVAAAAPPPAIKPMEGWALAGVSDSEEYKAITLVNLKTNERLRLTHYALPEDPGDNEKEMGPDKYVLVSISYEDEKPASLRTATAIVTKNGQQDEVKYDPKVAQMKPPAAAVALGKPGAGPGGAAPLPNLGGVGGNRPVGAPMPGTANAAGQNQGNQQLMALLSGSNQPAVQPAQPGQPGAPIPLTAGQTAPTNNAVPPVVPPPAPSVTAQPVGNAPAPGTPAPPARRRVVLPTPDSGAPANQ